MSRRLIRLGAIAVACAVLVTIALVLVPRPAGASSTVLTIFEGSAQVARASGDFASASDGDLVAVGDRVRTGAASHAAITFFEGSSLVLGPDTTITVDDASARGDAISIRISQTVGRTWASVHRLVAPDSTFEVRTPSATATVRGTGFLTEVRADGSSSVHTTDGRVDVSAQGATVSVGAGQLTTVAPGAPPTAPVQAPAPADRLRFGLRSPAYLAVVDPLGRTCGLVLPGPSLVRQIPGCLVTDAAVEPQLIDVPDAPVGTYSFVIVPRGSGGPYTLTASGITGTSLGFDLAVGGTIAPGETQGTTLAVSRAADGALTASGFAPISALLHPVMSVVLPSAAPSRRAGNGPTIDAALFPPLPSATPRGAVPSPVAAASAGPSALPAPGPTPAAATAGPTPAPADPTPEPRPSPTLTPTLAPTAAPTVTPAPTPAPVATTSPPASATPRPRLERGCEIGVNPGHGAGGADRPRCDTEILPAPTSSPAPKAGGSSSRAGAMLIANID